MTAAEQCLKPKILFQGKRKKKDWRERHQNEQIESLAVRVWVILLLVIISHLLIEHILLL